MLQIDNYITPSDLDEAYSALQTISGSVVLGGCCYLRLGSRKLETAIDLSRLGLAGIEGQEKRVEIGAMTTLRQLETDPLLKQLYNGLLSQAVEGIVGIQLRNCVTIGGSVAGRYPFSDPITALLALDAKVQFHHHGEIGLSDFLEGRGLRDILTKVILPRDGRLAAFTSVRRSSTDYAVLNVAVARVDDEFRVVVGSRPGRAVNATISEEFLRDEGLNETTAMEAGRLAAQNIQLGDNPRGSEAYRRAICPVLVRRALLEVMHAG